MPANLPSSFASAAAGQNRDPRGVRGDGRGSSGGDWSRRDGRSTNGTLTFRRSSTTPLGQASQQTSLADSSAQLTNAESMSQLPPMNDGGPIRYSREEMLDLYHPQSGQENTSRLYYPGWNPGAVYGNGSRPWGKANESHVPQEPGACWEPNGDITPIGLHEMTFEEQEVFSGDINSPLKPPALNKDGHQGNTNGRKASVSHATSTTYGVASPSSATRPSTRRRETVESNPFSSANLSSPTSNNRSARDDMSFWAPRKSGDVKEMEEGQELERNDQRDASTRLPFGNLIRSHTTGSPGTSSAWPPSTQSGAITPGTGGFGAFAMPSSTIGDKRVGGTSRLAHLIPKDGPDPKQAEVQGQQSWRPRPRTDTDPFGDDSLSGSAVLGGAQDTSAGLHSSHRTGTLGTPVKASAGDFGMSGLNLGGHGEDNLQVSPSETNPYRSPPAADRHDQDDDGRHDKVYGGNYPENSSLNLLGRGFGGVGFEGSDRSQTSSVGGKGFPLSGISGWSAPGPSAGTPDQERPNYGAAFGGSLFNPLGGDIQSPGVGLPGNAFGPHSAGAIGTGSIGRGSKLSSLLPAAMQTHHSNEHDNNLADSIPDLRQANPLGAIGRNNISMPARDSESPMRSSRGIFGEMFPSSDLTRTQRAFNSNELGAQGGSQSFTPVSAGLSFGSAHATAEPHSNPMRVMVMPDRMRWVYLDPQGHIQGPFTGLEMNDWYKANFFTPDLRVKKVEDPDFEPLGQLIRRIGNSREPFLVPQIGIPHGPPSQAGPFTPSTQNGIVPPLSGIFPSFGRTLTAEEQNNLERRKQEEQFLMAQQREFMMRQQVMSKYGMVPSLQHHSSAQSLQSQPSFGSMNSPMGLPQGQQSQQQPIGPAPPSSSFFDNPPGSQATGRTASGHGDYFRETDLTNLSTLERQMLGSMPSGPGDSPPRQPTGVPGDTLRSILPETRHLHEDPEGFRQRLEEFEDLRAQHEAAQAAAQTTAQVTTEAAEEGQHLSQSMNVIPDDVAPKAQEPREASAPVTKSAKGKGKKKDDDDALSLTQQVQKTQAAVAALVQPPEPGMPMPFPPPASTTPLPAPMAQRARSNLPEQYSRSQAGTPENGGAAPAQPPPLAPWAKDPGLESAKGPGLKEIQEAESRKAAKAEEVATAMRKAAMEQEVALIKEKEKVVAASAGLPATSTWGHGSPVSSTGPWSKPTTTKAPASGLTATSSAASKRTLSDIQREEELRKTRAKENTAPQVTAPTGVSKSYANLAGKPNQPLIPNAASPSLTATASGWATVGAGGKVKIPTGSTTQVRSASASTARPIAPSVVKPSSRPGPAANVKSDGNIAMEEFNKWVSRELSRGITGVSDIASFQATLDMLPLESTIISDAVYFSSKTMDGHRFAEEYIRRKKLAERGVVEKQPSDTGRSVGGGGWSEVAKKSSNPVAVNPRDGDAGTQAAGYKVVPGRKKGKK